MSFLGLELQAQFPAMLHAADTHQIYACIRINNACLLTSVEAISDKILHAPSASHCVSTSAINHAAINNPTLCYLCLRHLFSGKVTATPVVMSELVFAPNVNALFWKNMIFFFLIFFFRLQFGNMRLQIIHKGGIITNILTYLEVQLCIWKCLGLCGLCVCG